jgi:hypothetical protein
MQRRTAVLAVLSLTYSVSTPTAQESARRECSAPVEPTQKYECALELLRQRGRVQQDETDAEKRLMTTLKNIKVIDLRMLDIRTGMVVGFSVKNDNAFGVKDITVTCFQYGNSGTEITRGQTIIYDTFSARSEKQLVDVRAGVLHQQATNFNCVVTDFSYASQAQKPAPSASKPTPPPSARRH